MKITIDTDELLYHFNNCLQEDETANTALWHALFECRTPKATEACDGHAWLWEAHTNGDFMQGIIRTAETLPETECLAQLAEEACELAQAALKLRRAMGTGNPTPVSVEDAVENLTEEIADVQLCGAVIVYADGRVKPDNIEKVMKEKAARWLERLKERNSNG